MVAILIMLTVTVFVFTHWRLELQLLLPHFLVLLVPDHSKDEGGSLTKYREVVSEEEENTVVNRNVIVPKIFPFWRQ